MLERARLADQASGLRRLLRPAALRVLPVAGGRDGAERSRVIVNLAAAVVLEGHSVVVLDQSKGEVACAMGLKPRYELIHLMEGQKRFHEVALESEDGVRVLSGARGMAELARQGGHAQALFGAFAQLDRPADMVIVNIDEPILASALLPAGEGEVLLVVSGDAPSVTGAYAHIKQLSRRGGPARYRVLVGDADEAGDPEAVARNMARVARRFLSATLTYGGSVPRDPQLQRAERALASVVRSAPQSPAARAYRRLAQGIPDWNSFEIRSAQPGDGPARAAAH